MKVHVSQIGSSLFIDQRIATYSTVPLGTLSLRTVSFSRVLLARKVLVTYILCLGLSNTGRHTTTLNFFAQLEETYLPNILALD